MDMERAEPVDEHAIDQTTGEPAADEQDDDLVHVVKGADGAEMVPKSALVRYRKEAQAAQRRNAELEAQQQRLGQQLEEIRPYVEAIRANPRLIDAAQTATRPSSIATEQPEHDGEAIAWAEDNGLITSDGKLDIARARRQLDFLDQRADAKAEARMRPMRAQNEQQASHAHRAQAKTVTLKDGSRLASDESIDQAFGLLPAELAADPNVAALIPVLAAGIDVVMGRRGGAKPATDTPEPLYTESPGRRGAPISTDLQTTLDRMGVTTKDYTAVASRYVPGRHLDLE